MVTTMVHAQEDRLRSYELVAEKMGLAAREPAAASADPYE
jgi:hypothetical protein